MGSQVVRVTWHAAFRNLELVLWRVEVGDSEGLLGKENTHTMS